MTILLTTAAVQQETRVRLVFTNTLASGAFGMPAPSNYVITNQDGRGPAPSVQAALIVPNSPNVVELVLSIPLVRGALYTFSADGVPATDTSTVPSSSGIPVRWGFTEPTTNVEPVQRYRERVLYYVDLFFNGVDFQETATGDLDRIEGSANVTKALNRGVESDGLPWDPSYGARIRQYVDSPQGSVGTLRGSIAAQMKRDPRVAGVQVSYESADSKTYLYATPTLVSGRPAEQVTVEIPNG